MKHTKLAVSGLAVASLAAVVWFALPDDAQNAVKDTLGIAQSAPTATVHGQGRTLDQVLGDWGKDTRTVINGHNVPPVPDPAANKVGLLGVDSDHNGVRDDIDRYIAEQLGNDPAKYKSMSETISAIEVAMVNPTKENVRAYSKALACRPGSDVELHAQNLIGVAVEDMAMNTPQRRSAFVKAFAGMEIRADCSYFNNH